MAKKHLHIQASELVVCALMAMAVTAITILPGVAMAKPVKVDLMTALSSQQTQTCTNNTNTNTHQE